MQLSAAPRVQQVLWDQQHGLVTRQHHHTDETSAAAAAGAAAAAAAVGTTDSGPSRDTARGGEASRAASPPQVPNFVQHKGAGVLLPAAPQTDASSQLTAASGHPAGAGDPLLPGEARPVAARLVQPTSWDAGSSTSPAHLLPPACVSLSVPGSMRIDAGPTYDDDAAVSHSDVRRVPPAPSGGGQHKSTAKMTLAELCEHCHVDSPTRSDASHARDGDDNSNHNRDSSVRSNLEFSAWGSMNRSHCDDSVHSNRSFAESLVADSRGLPHIAPVPITSLPYIGNPAPPDCLDCDDAALVAALTTLLSTPARACSEPIWGPQTNSWHAAGGSVSASGLLVVDDGSGVRGV